MTTDEAIRGIYLDSLRERFPVGCRVRGLLTYYHEYGPVCGEVFDYSAWPNFAMKIRLLSGSDRAMSINGKSGWAWVDLDTVERLDDP